MLVRIPQVLNTEQVAVLRQKLESAGDAWVNGHATAGHQGIQVKNNQQIDEYSPVARELGDMILAALERNPLFISAALPKQVYPPLFNRYKEGMEFGYHVDGAVRLIPGTGMQIRTDISVTLFLAELDEYDGGELVIEDTYGTHHVKLPAGDMIIYPSTSLHCVNRITRGVRLASFFWIQSMVKESAERTVLFELDCAIQRLIATGAEAAKCVKLSGCYHNLLRKWSEI